MATRYFYGPKNMTDEDLADSFDEKIAEVVDVDQVLYLTPAGALKGNSGPDQPGNATVEEVLAQADLYRVTIERVS